MPIGGNKVRVERGFLAALAVLMVNAAVPACAQERKGSLQEALGLPDELLISGSTRVRHEALGGQSRAGLGERSSLTSIRTILLAEYRRDGFRIGGEIYDSRAYGADRGSGIGTGEVNVLEPVQAYIAFDAIALPGLQAKAGVQLGRFTLNLGSRRLVAADDFRNTTNGFTGGRFDIRADSGTSMALIYTLVQQRRPDDAASIRDNERALDRESFDQRLWGGVLTRPGMLGRAAGEISYFGFAERDSPARPTRNRHLSTVGARLWLDPRAGLLDYEIEGMYQFGRIRASQAVAAARLPVSAWFTHIEFGYSFPGELKARLSFEYEYASGDQRGRGFGRFDTLFGSRRADLAPSGIYAQIGRANMSTPAVRVEMSPGKGLDAFVAYRAMWLASRTDAFSTGGVRDSTGRSGSFAGHQIEGRVRYWLVPEVLRGEVNAAWISKGRFLKRAPNAQQTGNTRYIAVAVTASF